MKSLLIIVFLFSISACEQTTTQTSASSDLAQIYTRAIGDFIKEANIRNRDIFDTLFIAKRKNGQADDFPDIELPEKIENTQIMLINPKLGEKSQMSYKKHIYINLLAWIDKKKASFIFIVFSNGFVHQYDYNVNYAYHTKRKQFELQKITYNGPPFDK